MPSGRYPDRVKSFRKWAADRVDKAKINDSATSHGGRRRSKKKWLRKKRRKRLFSLEQ